MGPQTPSRVRIPLSPPLLDIKSGKKILNLSCVAGLIRNLFTRKMHVSSESFEFPVFENNAPVAQLDRVLGYELRGREFESLRARHTK
jgi:hypothetical protein